MAANRPTEGSVVLAPLLRVNQRDEMMGADLTAPIPALHGSESARYCTPRR